MNPALTYPVCRPTAGSRASLLALALTLLATPIEAQPTSQVQLTNSRGCKARITGNGIAEISIGKETYRFEDLPPFFLRTTTIAGGQVLQADYWGNDLTTTRKSLTQLSPSQCLLTWSACALPGLSGSFDLVYQFEILAARNAVAVRGRVQANSLAIGIHSIGYRQYLAADTSPQTVTAGLSGAVHLKFELLPLENWNRNHPLLQTNGLLRLGASRVEEFLATRTSESMLIAATHHGNRRYGMLVTRDVRFDPENIGRDQGIFGANPVGSGSPAFRYGVGVLSYLPNDNRPANGGPGLDAGSGLVFDFFNQENSVEPYWDAIRAYRDLYVDPLFVGLDKTALRPQWAEHCMFMAINVFAEGAVRVEPVITFVDQFLQYYDKVTDLAILLWGATDEETFAAVPGLDILMSRLRDLEALRQRKIHPALYYVPSSYIAGVSGGSRLAQVCRDPFGSPLWFPAPDAAKYSFLVNTGGLEALTFYQSWLASTFATSGAEGVYLDDALRNRHEFAKHYLPSAAQQGRVPDLVAGYLAHLTQPALALQSRYLITELGVLGRSVPGNLVQGVAGLEAAGAFFKDPTQELTFLPFLNDVAGGKHYLSGYSGVLMHSWLRLENLNDTLYYATQVVRGLVPLTAPLAIGDNYYDFFQLCRDGIIDCGDPRFRALADYSRFANAGAGFYARHARILAGWKRQPFPGTHDIPKRQLKFYADATSGPYRLTVDEIPFGCFSSPDLPLRLATALANPLEGTTAVRLRFVRKIYGLQWTGQYRVVFENQDGMRTQLTQGSSGDLECTVNLPGRQFGLVTVEPVR